MVKNFRLIFFSNLCLALCTLQFLAEGVHDSEGGVDTTRSVECLRSGKLTGQTLTTITKCSELLDETKKPWYIYSYIQNLLKHGKANVTLLLLVFVCYCVHTCQLHCTIYICVTDTDFHVFFVPV